VFQKIQPVLTKGVTVLGVSKDTTGSHKRFAEKFNLTFPLLSDRDATVIKAYDSWGPKKFWGREYDGIIRNTFLINPKGEIAKKYEQVDPTQHVTEILQDLEKLQS
jgi:peroxiredoxin Q/BCP